jgi:predicted O-methyltransferase YrrM
MQRAAIADRVKIDERESVVALSQCLERGEVFDFAFVDGCHWFECALIDVSMLCRLVRPGGVIAVDDTWMHAVSDAVSYCTKNLNCELVDVIERNGKPRLSVLRVGEIDKARPWDGYERF